jgi:hypothetical protein
MKKIIKNKGNTEIDKLLNNENYIDIKSDNLQIYSNNNDNCELFQTTYMNENITVRSIGTQTEYNKKSRLHKKLRLPKIIRIFMNGQLKFAPQKIEK